MTMFISRLVCGARLPRMYPDRFHAHSTLALTRWTRKGNQPRRLGVAAESNLSPVIREHSVRDVREALMVARNTDGKLVRRPLSPHLQVYRWPLSMALSISHRITGVGLSVGTILLTWWLVAAATSDEAFNHVQWFLGSVIGLILLFGWSAALIFHFFTGIRHLVWDMVLGFEKPEYTASGWATIIATVILTVVVWVVGLATW
jgi:succinate dehydrogenase / fumarate reductase, cytochrome b subunit